MHIQHIESTSGHTGNISGASPLTINCNDNLSQNITEQVQLFKGRGTYMYFQKYCPRFTNALVSNVKIRKGSTLRDGPFNLKEGGGAYGLFLEKNIRIPTVAVKNILILVEGKKII